MNLKVGNYYKVKTLDSLEKIKVISNEGDGWYKVNAWRLTEPQSGVCKIKLMGEEYCLNTNQLETIQELSIEKEFAHAKALFGSLIKE